MPSARGRVKNLSLIHILFEDLDIEQEIKDYYSGFYGLELTDDQVDLILNPTPESAAAF